MNNTGQIDFIWSSLDGSKMYGRFSTNKFKEWKLDCYDNLKISPFQNVLEEGKLSSNASAGLKSFEELI